MTPQDRLLCKLYSGACLFSTVYLICFDIVWLYWQRTLNTCQTTDLDFSRNCGCILYGVWGEFFFKGSDISNCYFVAFTPIPIAVWSAIMALYHGYRSYCMTRPAKVTLISKERVDSINTQLWPKPVIIFSTCMSMVITVLQFAAFVVLLIGYFTTCFQYKKFIINHLSAGGNLAKAIDERISCETSFDFLDYLQPDPVFLDYRYRRGSWLIDSDLCLKLSIYGSLATISLYLFMSIVNVKCCRIPAKRTVLNSDL